MPITLSTVYTATAAILPVVFLTYLAKRKPQIHINDGIKMSKKRTVVVAGGGVAGTDVVRAILASPDAANLNVILVTPRTHFVYLLAALRAVVDKNASLDTIFFPYDRLFASGLGLLKIGSVASIEVNEERDGGSVVLKDGEKVAYDALVLASGSTWEGPIAFPDEEQAYEDHVQKWRAKFGEAKNIVIAGGGAVGIELAGEIKDIYPEKNVTIVQGNALLLNGTYPDAFRKDIETRIKTRGIEVLLDDFIDDLSQSEPTILTRAGKQISCDLLVPAIGGRPNTSFITTISPSPLTDRGFVKVAPTLQVEKHPSIFAAGDIIDWPEVKQFSKVKRHVPVVTANVLGYLKGAHPSAQYKGARDVMIVTNGRNGGASYLQILWGLSFGDWVTRFIKSKGLMVERSRKALGL